jgi:hypothetical protein
MYENMMLRRIFGPKRDENCMHNKNLHNFFTLPNVIRIIKLERMRWVSQLAHMGAKSNSYRVLVGKPEGKRPIGRPRHKLEDNIKMDLKRNMMGWNELDSSGCFISN